jgi:hypothetical protein
MTIKEKVAKFIKAGPHTLDEWKDFILTVPSVRIKTQDFKSSVLLINFDGSGQWFKPQEWLANYQANILDRTVQELNRMANVFEKADMCQHLVERLPREVSSSIFPDSKLSSERAMAVAWTSVFGAFRSSIEAFTHGEQQIAELACKLLSRYDVDLTNEDVFRILRRTLDLIRSGQ